MVSRIFEVPKGNNQLKIKDMKKYYVNGLETTEQEAKAIEARNAEYMGSIDFSQWAKCGFITVVTK